MMKMNARTIACLIAGAALLSFAVSRVSYRSPRAAAASTSTPAFAERMITGAGRVEPASEEIRVSAGLDGRVQSVAVEEGDAVRRGQVMAVLENADLQARVELGVATVAEREAELERLMNGSRSEQRREAGAAVREMEAMLDHARVERQRRLSLMEFGAIARVEFEVTDREYNVAKARLDAARERAAMVDDEARPDDIKRARAEVDRARAQLAEANAQLAKTVIRSPIDGIVLRKNVKAGESVLAVGEVPVVTLGDCSRLRVRVDVDENDVARLRVGQAVWVRADAYGERKFRGAVASIGKMVGRKNIRTDEPAERVDAKVLETLVQMEAGTSIPVGLRVDAYIDPRT